MRKVQCSGWNHEVPNIEKWIKRLPRIYDSQNKFSLRERKQIVYCWFFAAISREALRSILDVCLSVCLSVRTFEHVPILRSQCYLQSKCLCPKVMSSAKSEPTRPIGSGGGWGWVFKQSPPVFSSYWLEIDYCNFPILCYFNKKKNRASDFGEHWSKGGGGGGAWGA